MNITLDNIIAEIQKAWRYQHDDIPLAMDADIVADILERAEEYKPYRLLAMWIMYIQDADERRWGVGIDKFLTTVRLNKWAARLGNQQRKDKGLMESEQRIFHAHYTCEHAHMYDNGICTIAIESGHGWDVMDRLPDVWPDPCPVEGCGGRWYRDDAHPNMAGRLAGCAANVTVVDDLDDNFF